MPLRQYFPLKPGDRFLPQTHLRFPVPVSSRGKVMCWKKTRAKLQVSFGGIPPLLFLNHQPLAFRSGRPQAGPRFDSTARPVLLRAIRLVRGSATKCHGSDPAPPGGKSYSYSYPILKGMSEQRKRKTRKTLRIYEVTKLQSYEFRVQGFTPLIFQTPLCSYR